MLSYKCIRIRTSIGLELALEIQLFTAPIACTRSAHVLSIANTIANALSHVYAWECIYAGCHIHSKHVVTRAGAHRPH